MSKALEAATLAAWKAREAGFDARVARPVPDNLDMASGAYAAMQAQVKAAIIAFLDAAAGDVKTLLLIADRVLESPEVAGFDRKIEVILGALKEAAD